MLEDFDHRALGASLDLFHFQDEAPGMVFWHPRGLVVYRGLQEAASRQLAAQGYGEVRTPQLLRQPIWEASGHWAHFRDDMFTLESDALPAALKPVSCPGHIQIFKSGVRSYRDLPLRLAEFGVVHRNERSGSLHGLFRLRQFTQDDGHIFCLEEHVREEVGRFCRALVAFYAAFGFLHPKVGLSTRPAVRDGSDREWDWAEALLADAARDAGIEPILQLGGGAFYGPKLEFVLRDRFEREWQCGTIQLDFVLPSRFGISYIDARGARARPVMLHRAIYGSLERFFGVLLEQHRGALPAWLSPVQVRLVPLGRAGAYAEHAARELASAGVRVERADGPDSLAKKVAMAHEQGVPYVVVLGDREAKESSWSVRARGEPPRSLSVQAALQLIRERCAPPPEA